MSPEKLEVIRSALNLQGELKMKFMRAGFNQYADAMASDIMDMFLKSDVVKPEIQAIYQEIADSVEK